MKAKKRRPNAAECRTLATPATGDDRPDYRAYPEDPGHVPGSIFQGRWIRYRGLRFAAGHSGELLSPDETEVIYWPGQAMPEGRDVSRRGIWALVDRWLDRG